jgi:hypothetical protein
MHSELALTTRPLAEGTARNEDETRDFLTSDYASTNDHPFAGLPFAGFWVFLSGKEILGRKRRFVPTGAHYLATSLVWLGTGVAGMYWALQGGWLSVPLYLVSMVLIIGGARYMVATNIHMMAHNLMFATPTANLWWGEVLTTIFFIQSYTRYRADHLKHHGRVFGTLKDGDGLSVVKLGFTPEKSRAELWRNLLRLCCSPRFHLNFIKGRCKENFVLCPNYRKVMAGAWLLLLVVFGYRFGAALILHAYILPVILFSQVASLLQLLCEHVWVSTTLGCRDRHLLLTNARYCGVPLPKRSGNIAGDALGLLLWAGRTVFVELPARIMVLQGSLPEHDWHHRHAGSKQWPDGKMLRACEVAGEMPSRQQPPYLEVWGSIEILDRVFRSISRSLPFPEMSELMLAGKLDYGDIK